MGELAELNQKMYEFVDEWAEGVNLMVSGVSLPDCMAYDALSVLGRQLLNAAEPAAEPQPVPEAAHLEGGAA